MILSPCYPSALAFLLGPHDWVSPPFPTQGGGSDDTELRYSSQYEERLDPFSSFSKRVCDPGLRARQGIPENIASAFSPSPPHQPWSVHSGPASHVPDGQGSLHAHFHAMETQVHLRQAQSTGNTCLMVRWGCDSERYNPRGTLWEGRQTGKVIPGSGGL